MAVAYLSQEESLSDLIDRIPGRDRDVYRDFRSLRVEAAFDDRVFILFKPCGLDERNQHRHPEILTTVRVLRFWCNSEDACVEVQDDNTGEVLQIGYVPVRLFGYDVFVSVPPRCQLRWDARYVEGQVRRSLSYPLLIKTKNLSTYYSAGVTYAETPNSFRALFPKVPQNFY